MFDVFGCLSLMIHVVRNVMCGDASVGTGLTKCRNSTFQNPILEIKI